MIGAFYPIMDTDEAISRIVLEWVDTKISQMEEKNREYVDVTYRMSFSDFDKKNQNPGGEI